MTNPPVRDRLSLDALFAAHAGALTAYATRRVPLHDVDDVRKYGLTVTAPADRTAATHTTPRRGGAGGPHRTGKAGAGLAA